MKNLKIITSLIGILIVMNSCIREDNTPVKVPPFEGAIVAPEVGGAAQPNQVWIDLSDNTTKVNKRDTWDLGFYSGAEFRVVLNSSIMMAVGKIENATNIDAVTPEMVKNLKTKVQVADFQNNAQYIDNPSGDFINQTTGIAAISAEDSENAVYLLNMGKKLYEGTVSAGSVYTTSGESRGWKKIRILRQANGYKIQFANLEDTTHQEMVVDKNTTHHFSFVNLETKSLVEVQPKKNNWDIYFSVFTNLINNSTSYIFADMVLLNTLSNVQAYQVNTEKGQAEKFYNEFKRENIDESKFIKNEQRAIGSSWRATTGGNGAGVHSDRFYIIKDADGLYFKLRFLRMINDEGFRGYPQFEYKPL